MDTLKSLVFFRILRTTIYSTIALSFCAWIVQSSKYLVLLNNKLSLAKFFKLTSFLSVDIIAFLLPIALAISAGFVYRRLAESNQIIAMQASGIAPYKLLTPLLWLTTIIVGYLYVNNTYLSPLSWREFRRLEFNIKNNIEPPENAGQVFVSNTFSVYAQTYYGECKFGNIFIVDSRNPTKVHTIYALNGSIQNNILSLYNGSRIEVLFDTHKSSIAKFKSYVYNLGEIIDIQKVSIRPNERFLLQLLDPVQNDPKQTKELRALFHQKILSPWLTVILALLAFFLTVLNSYNRNATYYNMAWLVISIILLNGIFLGFANVSAKNDIFIYVNYLFIVVMLVISCLLIRKKHE